MNLFRYSIVLLIVFYSCTILAQRTHKIESPDGEIVFSFKIKDIPTYQIRYSNKIMINNSSLELHFKNAKDWGHDLKVIGVDIKEHNSYYNLIVGKASKIHDHYREMRLNLEEKGISSRKIDIVIRVYNDGLAFRYEFPKQNYWTSYIMKNEKTLFNIQDNPMVYTMYQDRYNNAHEALYNTLSYDEIKPETLMDMPTLFEFPDKTYMAITEANLRNYAGMYLIKRNGSLESQLSPHQGQEEVKVVADLPHRSPWRVIMLGKKISDLIESNIITSLNDPPNTDDFSWIKPGKTTFHWWNGDIVPDTTFAPGVNFLTNKYYIDFAAKHNIDYHAVIGYGGFPWYMSDAAGYNVVGPNTDVTQTVASLDMNEICDYAKQKGVGIHVWVHWEAIYPDLEQNFSKFEKWGIKGMMVDFMDRDDQEMVNIQEEILGKAVEHKLYIQFHGSFKTTGLHRTYPNEFTREGTYNYEQNKWNPFPISPEHDLNVVFTRMLAGSTDYHLGGFRAVPLKDRKVQYTRPLMGGTRCHMLGMYVVLESYLNMVADYPAAYEGKMGFDFIEKVPTTWDETKVPSAQVGEYAIIARRKGDDWYIGGINNSETRTIEVALDFLKEGNYELTLYEDRDDSIEKPNSLKISTMQIDYTTNLMIKMVNGGGVAMIIKPL